MRLIKRYDNGNFNLVTFQNNPPKYAILSHTWGAHSEEVSFLDMRDGTGKAKPGYKKIKFCVEQAARDGLRYSWVDTCCIDKSNDGELTASINSMFRWYQQASRCYVYLADVFDPRDKLSFSRCRWFTRGWTVQELLAPRSVQFFAQYGQIIGDKRSLEKSIWEITGIPTQALRGMPLSEFSPTERISWAERRATEIEEDAVYCLLGLLNIYMPLIYGEGKGNALKRLSKEVNMVWSVTSAAKVVSNVEDTNLKAKSSKKDSSEPILTAEYPMIVVLGESGTGKSSFIKAATGESSIEIGSGLKSSKYP
jgi:Heterokaryon incompatibility protein (HET)